MTYIQKFKDEIRNYCIESYTESREDSFSEYDHKDALISIIDIYDHIYNLLDSHYCEYKFMQSAKDDPDFIKIEFRELSEVINSHLSKRFEEHGVSASTIILANTFIFIEKEIQYFVDNYDEPAIYATRAKT